MAKLRTLCYSIIFAPSTKNITILASFASLGVSADLIKALNENHIESPTEIQVKTIPFLNEQDTDFIGLAQTGTGKTAAFGLPLIQKIDGSKPYVQAIVLSPTRELAKQIAKQLFRFTKYYPEKIFTEAICGGDKIDAQIEKLKRPTQIVVATPGRLNDLLDRQAIDLSQVEYVILDEADEMLNMGFKKDIDRILRFAPKERHTWLFSATMPEEIKQLIKQFMKPDAHKVEVDKEQLVNKNIEHFYTLCDNVKEKVPMLLKFLKKQGNQQGIVFCKTRATVRKLAAQLEEKGLLAKPIQGEMFQSERDKVMRMFRSKKTQILVATDVAARGLDIKNLGFVAHYNLPEQIEYYTHRSGRTGRAGRKGLSMCFVVEEELEPMEDIEMELDIVITPVATA
ncbi:DEAD/DEAH box helicase [Limibacter armeniacum]|uniref:DEAD/DEAH box helicase n=1 Tax=Limibacter armeniacum TaxID=466084 RepID=UPI002FE52B40